MKNFFALLLLAIIVQSCATDRIRYVRVKGQQKEMVDVDSKYKDELTAIDSEVDNVIRPLVVHEDIVLIEASDDPVSNNVLNSIPGKESDELTTSLINEEEDPLNEKVSAALWAEDQAFRSRRNMRLSIIFLGLSIIPLIGPILFFIPALILFIIGWTQYASANRSRYITVKGEALLEGAKKGFYIWGVYAILALLGAALLIAIYYW